MPSASTCFKVALSKYSIHCRAQLQNISICYQKNYKIFHKMFQSSTLKVQYAGCYYKMFRFVTKENYKIFHKIFQSSTLKVQCLALLLWNIHQAAAEQMHNTIKLLLNVQQTESHRYFTEANKSWKTITLHSYID